MSPVRPADTTVVHLLRHGEVHNPQGVHLPPSAFESWFVSASHDDAAVDRVISALPAAARAVTDSFATLGS